MDALYKSLPFLLVGAIGAGILKASPRQSSVTSDPPVATVNNSEQFQVIRVSDGDTLLVTRNSKEFKIRLCGIDAPEKDQPLGMESKANLERLVSATGGVAQIVETDRDRYGRIVGEVFLGKNGEVMAQTEQLISGNAYLYRQYLGGCPNKSAFEDAESIAQNQRLGVWGRTDLVKPWEHRRNR